MTATPRLRLRTTAQLRALAADPATDANTARVARHIISERSITYSLNARR